MDIGGRFVERLAAVVHRVGSAAHLHPHCAVDDEHNDRAVVPVWQGQMGHPPLLARSLFGKIAQLTGDAGARRLFDEAGTNLLRVDVGDSGILADADTPDALAALHAGKD